ncbi:unnamed protein product [Lepeophtheirus salmonis]|uniref:(salmon louse) hypothetical protein n=1 Tax=Lepeophtheirus salmonis TaxID=72036 RepID=A0A7R8CW19_LEPSM|nr:RNA-binding protein FUS-like [Lepeophtheirus salmonis]CAB4063072.1 unnamed protein product [Lepeophtheirus salmonis]CAF2916541.1 unnamed protein product [Lepeophtheirus salmonis]
MELPMSQTLFLVFSLLVLSKSVLGDSGYSAPSYSASSYGAPSYSAPSYGAPSYSAPSYKSNGVQHTHHHFYHGPPQPQSQRPSYAPSPYQNSIPQYYQGYAGNNRGYAQGYGYGYGGGGYEEDEYIHLNKKELTRGALLLGAGVLKGIVLTGLINNANNGIQIG